MGFAAAVPGMLVMWLAGSEGVLVLAAIVFAVAAVFAVRIPATQVAADDTSPTERQELRGGILLAASAMGLLRGIVGFLTFLVAFSLRTDDAPTWQFGLILAASGIGSLGFLLALALRRNGTSEERILQVVLAVTGGAGLLAAWAGGLVAATVLAAVVGMAAGTGKLAFDSVVQRDAPDANRGCSFARFETRFQLTWVAGAIVPVVVSIPMPVGFVVITAVAGFALFSYLAGLRALAAARCPPTTTGRGHHQPVEPPAPPGLRRGGQPSRSRSPSRSPGPGRAGPPSRTARSRSPPSPPGLYDGEADAGERALPAPPAPATSAAPAPVERGVVIDPTNL